VRREDEAFTFLKEKKRRLKIYRLIVISQIHGGGLIYRLIVIESVTDHWHLGERFKLKNGRFSYSVIGGFFNRK
jgi:hypothetical protein